MREIKFRAWWHSEEHKNERGGETAVIAHWTLGGDV